MSAPMRIIDRVSWGLDLLAQALESEIEHVDPSKPDFRGHVKPARIRVTGGVRPSPDQTLQLELRGWRCTHQGWWEIQIKHLENR
jgi:hypothetical protein